MTELGSHCADRTLVVSCAGGCTWIWGEGLRAVEGVLGPPGSLLATDRSRAVVLVWFLLNVFGVGVSCRKLYYFVVYLYVNGSGSITSVGEERANLSAVVYL